MLLPMSKARGPRMARFYDGKNVDSLTYRILSGRTLRKIYLYINKFFSIYIAKVHYFGKESKKQAKPGINVEIFAA
ncbi:hypothetical protein Krac_12229 [Ktedonobacter racemifer DSM 44963]|uniref:Uncharacterized protein n=1 Tax=Ktedonobacter racemifer DSM 44963 TaxID=485913 RepID=D6TFX0_KTERA|nr:hypothetical protein Krac_12229 [Ktedonobacter racemifer DSM 44963]